MFHMKKFDIHFWQYSVNKQSLKNTLFKYLNRPTYYTFFILLNTSASLDRLSR